MTQSGDSAESSQLREEKSIMKSGRYGLRTLRRLLLVGALGYVAQFASAESDYAAAWGPSVGAMVPMLDATDQDGNEQTLSTLKGSNGVLFVFNRSVDW
jgi:hypothetical protein